MQAEATDLIFTLRMKRALLAFGRGDVRLWITVVNTQIEICMGGSTMIYTDCDKILCLSYTVIISVWSLVNCCNINQVSDCTLIHWGQEGSLGFSWRHVYSVSTII